jgi:hypothetical protein
MENLQARIEEMDKKNGDLVREIVSLRGELTTLKAVWLAYTKGECGCAPGDGKQQHPPGV